MIKFGIPSMETVVDRFPGQAVITLHELEKPSSKRRFTLSKTAAEQLGVEPGLSKVGFSFDGGNYIAVIPDSVQAIASKDRLPVNKELTFISKEAYDYMTTKFGLSSEISNHLVIEKVEDVYGMKVGSFSSTPLAEVVSTPTAAQTDFV